jgi:hypothetical protein
MNESFRVNAYEPGPADAVGLVRGYADDGNLHPSLWRVLPADFEHGACDNE